MDPRFHPFYRSTAGLEPPPRFTFPLYYQPHPLAILAAEQLQVHLREERDWDHDFGLGASPSVGNRGKMFGVLVVRHPAGRLGFLRAHSGKLAESNHLPGFVPPVYDLLDEDGFYKRGERRVNVLNEEIERLEQDDNLARTREQWQTTERAAADELATERAAGKAAKRQRDTRRQAARPVLSDSEYAALDQELAAESIARSFALRDLARALKARTETARQVHHKLLDRIETLRQQRAALSQSLQQRIFAHYRFRSALGTERALPEIFAETPLQFPPAGAGECAAPKLLQYAYLHAYTPLCLAEFWWGESPPSEVRHHGHYYPACRGKCEPILGHMLRGLDVDPNPLLDNPAAGKTLTTVYEDDYLLVVNKPPEFLSVPGRRIEDSVYIRMRNRYPRATGPLIVHRLDMSTSGLLLLTKTKAAHQRLQQQFFKRSIHKEYLALLSGPVADDSGTIDLPLRLDYLNRPQQMVCFEEGRTARTHWRVLERRSAGITLVEFIPVTGRTHQLRVHAAHPLGLNAPIVGDDIYGTPAGRLHLQARVLAFRHPETGEVVRLELEAEF